jgi:hypothetical protein
MGNNVFIIGGTLGLSTSGVNSFGITAGGQYLGGLAILPNGEVDSVVSLSAPVGFGVATPIEAGVQTIVLKEGVGLHAFLGPGGSLTVQSISQAGVV